MSTTAPGYRSGVTVRAHPQIIVLQGFGPETTFTRSRSMPIKSGVTIYSGQVVVPELVSSEWVWALADRDVSAHLVQIPGYAYQDSFELDVVDSGLLTALDADGQFTLQTGYYNVPSVPLTAGAFLTFGSTTNSSVGKVETCARGGGATLPVIGVVCAPHNAGPISLVGQNSEASDLNVVQLNTRYDPRNASS